jgi:predicted RNase H-like HicB family nuclease
MELPGWNCDTIGNQGAKMRAFTAVVERCPDTGLYVGYVPGFPGAHSQAETLDDLHENLREVIEMLLEDGEPKLGNWKLSLSEYKQYRLLRFSKRWDFTK